MFGHKDGKVEYELKAILGHLKAASKEDDFKKVKVHIDQFIIPTVEELIALSGKIHDLIEKEL